MKERNQLIGHLACFTAYAIFGLNIIVCKDITGNHLLSPFALFALRSVGAGLLFWLLSLFMPSEKVEMRDFPRIFMASLLGFFLTQTSFLMAISDITPMDCSIVSALSPIYTMFIAAIALKEPITWKKAGGVLISFCGIVYLILNSVTSAGGVTQTKPVGVALIGNIQAPHIQIFGRDVHEMDFPLLHIDFTSDGREGNHPAAMVGIAGELYVGSRFLGHLRHLHYLLLDTIRTEKDPSDVGEHVFLYPAYHCHYHQHCDWNGCVELAESIGSGNRIRRSHFG